MKLLVLLLPLLMAFHPVPKGGIDPPIPKKYDYWPSNKTVVFAQMTLENLTLYCKGNTLKEEREHGYETVGCEIAFSTNDVKHGCLIILPYDDLISHEDMNHFYHHELAHCNGWEHPE